MAGKRDSTQEDILEGNSDFVHFGPVLGTGYGIAWIYGYIYNAEP